MAEQGVSDVERMRAAIAVMTAILAAAEDKRCGADYDDVLGAAIDDLRVLFADGVAPALVFLARLTDLTLTMLSTETGYPRMREWQAVTASAADLIARKG